MAQGEREDSTDEQPIQLPAIEYHPETAGPAGNQRIGLDQLGPIVVNEDGTMSRITNWANMSEYERATTMRIIPRRNAERMDRIRQQEELKNNPGNSSQIYDHQN